MKKKSKFGRWQKRWFRVTDHFLLYAHDKASLASHAVSIDLKSIGAIQMEAGCKTFELDMVDNGMSCFYQLRADSVSEALLWRDDLRARRHVLARQPPLRPISQSNTQARASNTQNDPMYGQNTHTEQLGQQVLQPKTQAGAHEMRGTENNSDTNNAGSSQEEMLLKEMERRKAEREASL